MSEWAVQTAGLSGTAQTVARCQAVLEQISSEINSARNAVNRQCPALSSSCAALSTIALNVHRQSDLSGDLSGALQQISQKYQSVEAGLCNAGAAVQRQPRNQPQPGGAVAWVDAPLWKDPKFISLLASLLVPQSVSLTMLNTLLNGSEQEKKFLVDVIGKCGVIGGIVKTVINGSKIFETDNVWKTLAGTTLDGLKALKPYASVAAAKGADAKWAAALGLNTKTVAEKIGFAQNLGDTFTGALKESFTTPLGLGITAATGVVEAFENYDEYKSGKISGGRAIAETVLETGTKVIVAAGAKALSTAALGALCGTVGAPALAIGAGAVAITWAADSICQWATGLNGGESKKLDEFISDTLIDTFKPGGHAQKAVEAVGGAVSSAIDGVKTGWKAVCSWFSQ